MVATLTKPKSMEDIVKMPDDGINRWFVKGELQEAPMSFRNRYHSQTMTCVAQKLKNWSDSQPEPRGRVLTGDTGVILDLDPETSYGLDVGYFSAEVMAKQSKDWSVIHGTPVLAVKIMSPTNDNGRMQAKIDDLLEAGTLAVWVLDPHYKHVIIYQPDLESLLVNSKQLLEGGSILPGFKVKVSELFE